MSRGNEQDGTPREPAPTGRGSDGEAGGAREPARAAGRFPDRWPVLSRQAVREVDRRAIEEFGIPGIVLMENAARGLCDVALDILGPDRSVPPRVLICCGGGNNGGDGYALARHLHNAGADIRLAILREPRGGTDAATNAHVASAMSLPTVVRGDFDGLRPHLVVDALFGTGLDRALEGDAEDWVTWINQQEAPVLAVDVPSGLDADSGEPLGPTVRADCTATFVGLKTGLVARPAQPFCGRLEVIDIGVPCELVAELATEPATPARRRFIDPA